MDGTLEQVGDRWQLRFARSLAHPPEKVWRALTEPEHLAAWFPTDIEGEWVAGAPMRFVHRDADEPPMEGEVVACEPPTLLAYRWGEDELRFELQPEGDGTLLVFVDTIAELGKAARDGAGWHTCLDQLEYELAGEDAPWSSRDRWREVHDGYVERFGPQASSIGPPESVADAG